MYSFGAIGYTYIDPAYGLALADGVKNSVAEVSQTLS